MEVEHPRWGLIQGVVAHTDLKAGQEAFTYYGYTENSRKFPSDYPWYWEAKNKIKEEKMISLSKHFTKSKQRSKRNKRAL